MKNSKAGMRAPWWALVLLAGSFFIGCTKESLMPPVTPGPSDGVASVTLKVNTPQATLPTAFTRSQTATESRVSEVKVLAFDTSNGSEFKYILSGTEVTATGENQTRFKIDLPPSDDPLKLMILANASDAFGSVALHPGMSETEVRGLLNAAFSSAGIQGDLPMYGEIGMADGVDASQNYELSVTLLRGVARVDVVKDLVSGSPDFILEEVYAFRAKDAVKLIPDALDGGTAPKVSAPSVPEGAGKLTDPVVIAQAGAESIIQLYLPESEAATSNSEKINGATTIVIGGRFGGEGNPVTYYRADFNSGIAGHPFGQILRNHRYIFNIKKVGAEGWPTPEDAANNLSSSIQVDVQTWEDFSSELYYGDDRFAVSSREISLRYVANRQRRIDVESTLGYRIQWVDAGGNAVGNSTADYNTPVSNGHFDAWIVQESGDKENVTHLVFRTRNNNHLGGAISNTLRITAGRWSVDITVKQDHSALYSGRILNILTAVGIGDLGVDMVAPDASGLAMRRVLDAQFSPAGTIRIGGFSFTRIPNTAGYVGTSTEANLTVLRRIFGAQDIIYFPYGIITSSEVADLLLQWLDADKKRVLIIGTDSDGSNKPLRLKEKVLADGSWSFSNVATVTPGFRRAPASAGSDDFFAGPFGAVTEEAAFNRLDATLGYSPAPAGAVTPLITSSSTSYPGYMIFGANLANRIFYLGDANLLQVGRMSNDSGNVSSDLDRLMANAWAWMVEQVIYGDS